MKTQKIFTFIVLIIFVLVLFGCKADNKGDNSEENKSPDYLTALVGTWRTMKGGSNSNVATIRISSAGVYYFKAQNPNGNFLFDYTAKMRNVTSTKFDIEITEINGGSASVGDKDIYSYTLNGNILETDRLKFTKQSSSSDFNLTLLFPYGSETLNPGVNYNITWSSVNIGNWIKIELCGSSLCDTISSLTLDTGSYSWTIPSNQLTGTNYRILISSVDYPLFWDIGSDFTIEPLTVEVWLNSVADAYVSSGSPDENYGNEKALYTGEIDFGGASPVEYLTFIKFDLSNIPYDAKIISAKFSLLTGRNNVACGRGTSAKVTISEVVSEDWTENGVTYNNMPSYLEPIDLKIISNFGDCIAYIYEFDFKGIATMWVQNINFNNGISIKSSEIHTFSGGGDCYCLFYSGELSYGPQLIIKYQ